MDVDELWSRYSAGDKTAREPLILAYMPLVKSIARRLREGLPASVEYDDLVSYGTFGLIEAIDKFEPERGFKFETFAVSRIRGGAIDGLRSMEWTPRNIYSQAREVDRASNGLTSSLQRPPTDREVAVELGWETDRVTSARAKATQRSLSALDEVIHTGSDRGESLTLADTIADPNSQVDPLEMADLQGVMADAIHNLTEKEQMVLVLYYFEHLKFSEIGELLEVSESRICQIHMSAIDSIRASMR
jgi:RNA polymerase sigma factor for flagellar operon FliA